MKRVIVFSLYFLSGAVFATENKNLLSIGVGEFDFLRQHYRSLEARVEWKPPVEFHKFRPLLGVMATTKGACYSYAGICLCLKMQKVFFIEPNFAAGFYYKGKGKDLGCPLEFRSGIEIGREFSDQSRIGVHFYHLSNASIGRRNPGEESLVVFYSFPLERKD